MAGAGIGNSAGFVQVDDGANPRNLNGVARQTISGGVFVFASGANNVVSSGTNSYVATDVLFAANASGAAVNGIALQTVGSNAAMAVATRGEYILVANGTVTAGHCVKCDGKNSVANIAAADSPGVVMGRAVTSAASGGHAIIHLTNI